MAEALVQGPRVGLPLRMMVDTGATYSMLTEPAARRLGLAVTAGRVEVATANGAVAQQVAVIDAVTLDGARLVGPFTAVICTRCAWPELDGVLGLNVLRHFSLHLDPDASRLELLPRAPEPSAHDAAPFVMIQPRSATLLGSQAAVAVELSNASSLPIHDIEVTAELPGAVTRPLITAVAQLAPKERRQLRFALVVAGPDRIDAARIGIRQARW